MGNIVPYSLFGDGDLLQIMAVSGFLNAVTPGLSSTVLAQFGTDQARPTSVTDQGVASACKLFSLVAWAVSFASKTI